MRKWINLFESPTDAAEIVQAVAGDYAKRFNETPHQTNRGRCFGFSEDLVRAAPSLFQSIAVDDFLDYDEDGDATGFDEKLLAQHWPMVEPFPGMSWTDMFAEGITQGTHAWGYSPITGLSYDIETPEGVRNPFDLRFFDEWKTA